MTHIVYVIDEKYLPCLLVSIFSLLESISGNAKITIFTAGHKFDHSSIEDLCSYFENYRVQVRQFDTSSLFEYANTTHAVRFPAISMLPLFLPWLIKDKCLFLDADTLVKGDVSQLFDINLDGSLIGACQSYPFTLSTQRAFLNWWFVRQTHKNRRNKLNEKAKRLGFSNALELGDKFFGSGVILYDTRAIRLTDPNQELMDMATIQDSWVDDYVLPDMDRMNQFFKDRVHYFNLSWDISREVSKFNGLYAEPKLWSEIRSAIRNPNILHFSGLFERQSWQRPIYRGSRYRLYRSTCQRIYKLTGINVINMFNERI